MILYNFTFAFMRFLYSYTQCGAEVLGLIFLKIEDTFFF